MLSDVKPPGDYSNIPVVASYVSIAVALVVALVARKEWLQAKNLMLLGLSFEIVGAFGIGGQHSTFVMAGAGVREGAALQREVRVIDVAPTLCYLLGWPMPRNAEGGVIYEALEDTDRHMPGR